MPRSAAKKKIKITNCIFLLIAIISFFYLSYGTSLFSKYIANIRGINNYDISLSLFGVHLIIALLIPSLFYFLSHKFNYKELRKFSYIAAIYSIIMLISVDPFSSAGGHFSYTQFASLFGYLLFIIPISLLMILGIKFEKERKSLLHFSIIILAIWIIFSFWIFRISICC